MGTWDHFYTDSVFESCVSTHYLKLPHVLHLAKGYLTKPLANGAVKSYIRRHEPEILTHLEQVVNAVSKDEAVQQQQQEAEARTLLLERIIFMTFWIVR